ncbi:hypothetical protein [Halomonas sp.]
MDALTRRQREKEERALLYVDREDQELKLAMTAPRSVSPSWR